MWDQLSSADIGRVRQELDSRRATIVTRHAEELKNLEAKQMSELEALNAKQAEVELLEALIDRFTDEFHTETPRSEDTTANEQGDTEPSGAGHGEKSAGSESEGALPGEVSAPPGAGPGPLQVQFPSPNFGAFRRFG
jgi:hypothetical protein